MSDPALRKSQHNKLIALLTKANAHAVTPLVLSHAKAYLVRGNQIMTKAEELHDIIVGECTDDPARTVQESAFSAIEATFQELCCVLQSIIDSFPNPTSSTNAPMNVKLPSIELPTFDGNYANWMSFKDLFLATVDTNRQLATSQKLQYLKSSLQGDPASLIRNITITNANYTEAWKILDERYSNNREIVAALLNKIITLKPLQTENPDGIQTLIDTTEESLRALKVLGRPTEQWDDLLVATLVVKLDGTTRKEWAKRTTTELPTMSTFKEFISSHVRGLRATIVPTHRAEKKTKERAAVRTHHSASSSEPNCQICNGSHFHFRCDEFTSKSIPDRITTVKKHHLCFNCLNKGHSIKECKSKRTCQKCNKRHHTLLHLERAPPHQGGNQNNNEGTTVPPPVDQDFSSHFAAADTQVLLYTAIVRVRDGRGTLQPVRVFLDSGSQATLITEDCVQRLHLPRQQSRLTVSGISGTEAGTTRGKVQITLLSQYSDCNTMEVEAHILPNVTGNLPKYQCKPTQWTHLIGLQLADPTFNKPGKVDILLGADYFAMLIRDGTRLGPPMTPFAQNTIFGYVLSGRVPVSSSHHAQSLIVTTEDISALLRKFWEVEEPPQSRLLTREEQQCEAHFTSTVTRAADGRYQVSIPFNSKKQQLGLSRETAIKRFHQVERRLTRNPEMRKQYVDFIEEYRRLGHLEKIPPAQLQEKPGATYYLPHHCVMNQSSTTTKLRVVFDGSAKTTTKLSLNDVMMTGPTVQDDLYDHLIRFRTLPIVLKADITKMYRQFLLQPEDADFHRILWREPGSHNQIEDYRLLTVTYGTACAPYLATRSLQQLGLDVAEKYPLASPVIIKDFYVDDLMSREKTDSRAISLYHQLTEAAKEGGMELCKWASNSTGVLRAIPEDHREADPHHFDPDHAVKALGIQWVPATDSFTFKYIDLPECSTLTKRRLLSDLAKVFDPLGLISPIIVRAKLLLQELWKLTLDWDQPVPDIIQQQWTEYQSDLKSIATIIIPRQISGPEPVEFQLHGFADASEAAYGAVVFLRTADIDNTTTIRMVTSKTKVAPLRQVTLPRLELMASLLLAELVDHIKHLLQLNCNVYLWSDSTITLKWIASPPKRWKTFVANRVSRIQEISKIESWRHVAGIDNPADLASRGATVSQLTENSFWFTGPNWLTQHSEEKWMSEAATQSMKLSQNVQSDGITTSDFDDCNFPAELMEERVQVVSTHSTTIDIGILSTFSTLTKMKRVIAFMFRFCYNAKSINKFNRIAGPLVPTELHRAHLACVKMSQAKTFHEDITSLKKTGKVLPNSNLRSLYPYIDNIGILRVSGRLQSSDLAPNRRHQIILDSSCPLVNLVIHHHHRLQFHSGFQLTWAAIQNEYWIIRGRDRVRHFIRSCVICRRYRAIAAEQLMGNLPSCRVTPSRPFLHTGVDYAGVFNLKNPIGRAPQRYKAYICLFVCMATKAIHLEAVSSLTTADFIATFRRFTSRRGLCAHLYSDCGTNFIGAEKELGAVLKSAKVNNAIADNLSKDGIKFHFNVPSAPHHGGLWEAGVKSAKHHLRRVMGDANFTYEQFSTVLCQVEAILNSRPLYPSSSDPTDLSALTPGHFLIGEPLLAVPDVNLIDHTTGRLNMYQQQQQRVQFFWKRWSQEYLNTLQQRNKWKWDRDNLELDELVLIIDQNQPPGKWVMGRVTKVSKGGDGKVRKVTVRTATSQFDRPITKLVPLIKSI